MTNSKQTFEATVRGQLLVAGGNGFDLTHPHLPAELKKQTERILAAHNSAITAAEVALLAKVLAEPKLNPYPGGSEAGEAYKQGVNEVCKLLVAELEQRKPKGAS